MFFLFFLYQLVYSGNTCSLCSFNNDRTELISVPSSSEEIVIPNTVLTIYGLDQEHYAFSPSKTTLKRFKFEEGNLLQTISKYSFYYCTSLEEINLSSCSHLTTIGQSAFEHCESVQTILLPISFKLTDIASNAFSYCSFSTITFPNTTKTIGQSLLAYNTKLSSIIFESTCQITFLPKYFIAGCESLLEFTIPKSVSSIDSFSENAIGLKNITVDDGNEQYKSYDGVLYDISFTSLYVFPINRDGTYEIPKDINNLKCIEWASFMYSKLNSIKIPETVEIIRGYAFASSQISSITLYGNLNTIEGSAFRSCTELTSIDIPGSVTFIGNEAFYGCISLTSIKLPASLTDIEGGIFVLCKNLTITFDSGSKFTVKDDFLVDSDITEIIFYNGNGDNIVIPSSVKKIRVSAFYNCQTITDVSFQDGSQLSVIERSSFHNCINLRTFKFPSQLQQIDAYAFQFCSNLIEVNINSPLTYIKEYCFKQCTKLSTITIVSSQNYIIAIEAFSLCTSLSSLSLSEKLTELGASCFTSCTLLSQLTLPYTVTTINESCFSKCGLLEVIFEENTALTCISNSLFYQCRSLHTIQNLPSSVSYIGEYSFAYTNITKFKIPQSSTKLGKYCFQGCSSLTKLIIPQNSNLEEIDFGVFQQCENFQEIENSSPNFEIENDALFDKNKTIFYVLPPKSSIRYFSFPCTSWLYKFGINIYSRKQCHDNLSKCI